MSSLNLIFGRTQKGKSTLAHHLAKLAHKAEFVFDPGDEFETGIVVTSGDEMLDALERRRDTAEPLTIVFRSEDPEREIPEFAAIVLRFLDCSVIVDEASFLQSPHFLHPALSRIIRKGPKERKKRDFWFTQHRASDCNGLVFGMAHTYTFFETKLVRDLDRISEQCGDLVAEQVSKLGFRDWLFYDVGTNRFYVNNAPDTWREELRPRSPRADEPAAIPELAGETL